MQLAFLLTDYVLTVGTEKNNQNDICVVIFDYYAFIMHTFHIAAYTDEWNSESVAYNENSKTQKYISIFFLYSIDTPYGSDNLELF